MKIGLIAVMTVFVSAANAQSLSQKQTDAFNNVHMEYAVCFSYYTAMKQCAPKSIDADASQRIQVTIDRVLQMYYRIGTNIGVTKDAMLSRIKMATDEDAKLLAGSCVNTSSLYVRHAERCKKLVENGDAIFEEYMKR